MPYPPVWSKLHDSRRHYHLLGILREIQDRMVAHKNGHNDQCPYPHIGPPARHPVQLWSLPCSDPVTGQHKDRERDAEGLWETDVPLGVVTADVEITVEPPADGGLEEEEVMVHEEESDGPSLQVPVKVGGGNQRKPQNRGCDHDELLEDVGIPSGMLAKTVKTVDAEGGGEHPGPEHPRPAEVHPEEWVQDKTHHLPGGRDGEADDGGPFAGGQRGHLGEVDVGERRKREK